MAIYLAKEFERLVKSMTLDDKIDYAVEAMGKAYELSKHSQAIAFSGGKDSTVIADMSKRFYPDRKPYIIFANTGLEYPESLYFARDFGREIAGERFIEARPEKLEKEELKYQAQREVMEWLESTGKIRDVLQADGKLKTTETLEKQATPEMMEDFRRRNLIWRKGTTKNYWYCVDQYGFPILGKSKCKLDAKRINIDCFLKYSNSQSENEELLEYYEMLKHVKISQHCCKMLKKEPSEREQAAHDVDVIFKGLMGTESRTRRINFCTRGAIYASKRAHLPGEDPFYHVSPMGFWTDADVWGYIERYNVRYSPLYDMSYTDDKGKKHSIERNGCWGCATGIAFADNQISMIRKTHPKLWRMLMDRGMAEQLMELRACRPNSNKVSWLDIGDKTWTMENRPCAFDDIGEQITIDDMFAEYDAENE